MTHTKNLLAILILFSFLDSLAQESTRTREDFSVTSDLYQSFISESSPEKALLNLFMTNMPKGGDLHHHYTGTIYAETYLEWVRKNNWKIDKYSLRIIKEGVSDSLISVDDLMKDDTLYRRLLTVWSDKDYENHFHSQPPPDQNFFNTFGYFGPVSNEYMWDGLKILKKRAIDENVQYIETMLSSVGASSRNFPEKDTLVKRIRAVTNQKELDGLLKQIDKYYSKDPSFQAKVAGFVSKVEKNHEGIDDENFVMRYQSYCVRVLDPLEVYTDLLAAFYASDRSPLIVGVNIVAPENNYVALTDYSLHMMMFNYLSRTFSKVNRALHAGELTLGMVRPKDLTFHLNEAIDIAKANRIGHGIDIAYENNSLELLENIKKNSVVEINLTSNDFILGVNGKEHPYTIYSKYGVPMVISTDDSGVSRNNLTNEYVLLASRYRPTYTEIKGYVYNSIDYSFLDQKLKERLKSTLDKKFKSFEADMANLSSKLGY